MYQPIYRPVLRPQPRPIRPFYDINYNEEVNWVHDRPDITDTPILEQKNCRCCWAIATTTCMGFHLCLQCRIQVILSSQELVDNVRLYSHDVYGGGLQDDCYRGTPVDAYAWCHYNGLPSEEFNLFEGRWRSLENCPPRQTPRYVVGGYVELGDWTDCHETRVKIATALMQQPLVACMQTTTRFEYIDGEGIYYELPSDEIEGLHVVVVVAMNLREDYFIIRNSWGSTWAKAGYAKVRCDEMFNFSVPSGRWMMACN